MQSAFPAHLRKDRGVHCEPVVGCEERHHMVLTVSGKPEKVSFIYFSHVLLLWNTMTHHYAMQQGLENKDARGQISPLWDYVRGHWIFTVMALRYIRHAECLTMMYFITGLGVVWCCRANVSSHMGLFSTAQDAQSKFCVQWIMLCSSSHILPESCRRA